MAPPRHSNTTQQASVESQNRKPPKNFRLYWKSTTWFRFKFRSKALIVNTFHFLPLLSWIGKVPFLIPPLQLSDSHLAPTGTALSLLCCYCYGGQWFRREGGQLSPRWPGLDNHWGSKVAQHGSCLWAFPPLYHRLWHYQMPLLRLRRRRQPQNAPPPEDYFKRLIRRRFGAASDGCPHTCDKEFAEPTVERAIQYPLGTPRGGFGVSG